MTTTIHALQHNPDGTITALDINGQPILHDGKPVTGYSVIELYARMYGTWPETAQVMVENGRLHGDPAGHYTFNKTRYWHERAAKTYQPDDEDDKPGRAGKRRGRPKKRAITA